MRPALYPILFGGPPSWLPKGDGQIPAVYGDFANGNYWYNGRRYGDSASWLSALSATFSRSSTAYYTNSAGLLVSAASGALRFDYDPVTLAGKGILLEGARTNVLLRSQEFDSATWTKEFLTVTADAIAAPDGTTTADTLTEDTTTNSRDVVQTTGVASATTVAISVYAKAGTRNYIHLQFYKDTNNRFTQVFDLSLGAVGETSLGGTSGTILSASIQALSNGWYRCVVVGSLTGASPYVVIGMATAASGNSFVAGQPSYLGSSKTVYLWGAQAEVGAFASSYIPTTSGSVTRAADSLIATPISAWFNQNQGTIFGRFQQLSSSSLAPYLQTDDAGSNYHAIYMSSGTVKGETVAASSLSLGTPAGARFKAAYAYNVNDFAGVMNGGTVQTDVSGALPPTQTRAIFGNDGTGTYFGWLEQLAYWASRVSNGEQQRLTT